MMFGFSITKLLILIAIIVAVWQGFKLLKRLETARAQGRGPGEEIARTVKHAAETVARKAGNVAGQAKPPVPQDLEWDEKSGSYVPRRDRDGPNTGKDA